jgi:hypothetical protein
VILNGRENMNFKKKIRNLVEEVIAVAEEAAVMKQQYLLSKK